ncbi:MAG: hypothetical protein PSN34_03955 [Urechidicola sp.]|nr:hypothetical protein [Urechidicola sp.]
MKQFLHKTVAFLMTFVVLFSTMSFTVDMHFCGDTLVDTAIFKEVKSCGIEMSTPSNEDCSVVKKDCCTDKQINYEGQDELKISFDIQTLNQQLFAVSFIYSYINDFEGLEENPNSFNDYPPPLIVRSIYKLDETFLI